MPKMIDLRNPWQRLRDMVIGRQPTPQTSPSSSISPGLMPISIRLQEGTNPSLANMMGLHRYDPKTRKLVEVQEPEVADTPKSPRRTRHEDKVEIASQIIDPQETPAQPPESTYMVMNLQVTEELHPEPPVVIAREEEPIFGTLGRPRKTPETETVDDIWRDIECQKDAHQPINKQDAVREMLDNNRRDRFGEKRLKPEDLPPPPIPPRTGAYTAMKDAILASQAQTEAAIYAATQKGQAAKAATPSHHVTDASTMAVRNSPDTSRA